MITRDEALKFTKEHLKNANLFKHCLASEAVMRALARRLGEDEEAWGLADLLHDADVEISTPENQGKLVGEMLVGQISEDMRYAMASHNTKTGVEPKSRFDYALTAGETITGLIVASALILPERKLGNLTKESVIKRFGEKRFAAGADRDLIRHHEKLGVTLEEFVGICLTAMKEIAPELGL